MIWTSLLLSQVLLTCNPTDGVPLRFGFPLPAERLGGGLRLRGDPRASLQWRLLQNRPDPYTGRVWVELCITSSGRAGSGRRVQIVAGGSGPTDPALGPVVRRVVQSREDADRRTRVVCWRWQTGEVDRVEYIEFLTRQVYLEEEFGAGETLTLGLDGGLDGARFSGSGIRTRDWRKAGVLPPGGGLGREFRRHLVALAPRLGQLRALRDRGDYLRSGGIMTNLEFDTSLALARLALAEDGAGRGDLLRWALRGALHTVGQDLDAKTSLSFAHGSDHRTGRPDPGHTWLSGILLVGCLAGDDTLLNAARRIARGLARHRAAGDAETDRIRDVGWPLLEMETWLRFAEDPEVEAGADRLVSELLSRWDEDNRVFRFGEGERRSGVYAEPAWVTAGCLLPGLRAYLRRRPHREVATMVGALERRLSDLVRNGRPGLPLRYWVVDNQVVGQSRQVGMPGGFMLLEGLPLAELRRCLDRGMVRDALLQVPREDDEDLATSFSIVGRCLWILR